MKQASSKVSDIMPADWHQMSGAADLATHTKPLEAPWSKEHDHNFNQSDGSDMLDAIDWDEIVPGQLPMTNTPVSACLNQLKYEIKHNNVI